jgi:alpha-tubulin suppressor-like RCC1 family protein
MSTRGAGAVLSGKVSSQNIPGRMEGRPARRLGSSSDACSCFSSFAGNAGLGHGDKTTQPRPALVESLSDGKVKIKEVSVGSRHMIALASTGQVWSWGNGEYGRCGNGKSEQAKPEPISLLENKKIVQVASGTMHNLALTDSGHIWVWGKNDAGQLGVGGSVLMDLNTMEEYPMQLEIDERDNGPDLARQFVGKISRIACGGNHSLAMSKEGRVFQWGQRTFLQPQAVEYGYLKASDDEEAEDIKTKKGKEGAVQLQAVKVRE